MVCANFFFGLRQSTTLKKIFTPPFFKVKANGTIMESIQQGLQSDLWKESSTRKRVSYFSYGPPDAGLGAYHVRDELSPVGAAQLKEMQVCLCWNRRDAWFLRAAAVAHFTHVTSTPISSLLSSKTVFNTLQYPFRLCAHQKACRSIQAKTPFQALAQCINLRESFPNTGAVCVCARGSLRCVRPRVGFPSSWPFCHRFV